MKYATIITALLLAVAAVQADEPGITLAWTMPTNTVDGSPLTDLGGAKLYYGTASSNYTQVVDVGNTNRFTLTVAEHGIEPGVAYYFNGTAYNTAGLESDFCNEVVRSFVIEDTRPKAIIIDDDAAIVVWRKVTMFLDGKYQQVWMQDEEPVR